ncbi:MAG: AAA family ATPase [Dehalococcoidia bacterium]|nr:AAA family ATPase [Dehalococcoidia bacterium]
MSLDGPSKPPNKTTKDAFFRETLARLPDAKPTSDGWHAARCPAHDDENPSLSVKQAADGNVLLKCHAGCEPTAVLVALGLATVHDYRDADGKLYGQVVKQKANGYKAFTVRRPDGNGGWVWNWSGVTRTLYRLPALLTADPTRGVLVVEGEKDADTLAALGFVVTTNPHGAEKWADAYSETLRNRRVIVVPDHDAAGERHVGQIARSLQGIAREVRIVRLPRLEDGEDVSDWLEKREGSAEELKTLARQAPLYAPSEPAPVEPAEEPAVIELEEGYEVSVPILESATTFTFMHVKESYRFGQRILDAAVTVAHERQGVARQPYTGHVGLLSHSGKLDLSKDLSDWFGGDWQEWKPAVTRACVLVANAKTAYDLAQSEHLVDMSAPPADEEMPVRWTFYPLVQKGAINLSFGKKNTLKSYNALRISIYVALGLDFTGAKADEGRHVLYVDAENVGELAVKRCVARLLAGIGKTWADLGGRLHVKPLGYQKLPAHLPALRRLTKRFQPALIVIDSGGYAAGDPDLNAPASAASVYDVLKALGPACDTSLVNLHEKREGKHQAPFGSVFWENGARLVWNLQADEDDSDRKQVGFFCRYVNYGRKPTPFSLIWTFDGDRGPVTVKKTGDVSAFAHEISLTTRLHEALADGTARTNTELATLLDAPLDTVTTKLSQGVGRYFATAGKQGRKTLYKQWREGDAAPDDDEPPAY